MSFLPPNRPSQTPREGCQIRKNIRYIFKKRKSTEKRRREKEKRDILPYYYLIHTYYDNHTQQRIYIILLLLHTSDCAHHHSCALKAPEKKKPFLSLSPLPSMTPLFRKKKIQNISVTQYFFPIFGHPVLKRRFLDFFSYLRRNRCKNILEPFSPEKVPF